MSDSGFPFNSPHADVILKSSDGVNFRVRKAILAETSSVFDGMFSLPTEQSAEADGAGTPALQVVDMTEDSATLEGFLRLCYPADVCTREPTFEEVSMWLVASRKYQMDRMERHVVHTLREFIATSPLRVYCLAVRYQLGEDLVRAAARGFLDQPIQVAYGHVPELDGMDTAAYARLLDYHNRCSAAVQQILSDPATAFQGGVWSKRCWLLCHSERNDFRFRSSSTHVFCTLGTLSDGALHATRASLWFCQFMDRCRALAKEQPSGKEVSSESTIARALLDAGKCDYCRDQAWDDMHAFAQILARTVDFAIEMVRLKIV
ncbi:hypothetical protein EVJ58_g9692 [Rhodofomes roseus]|uniref:BTB domain-containing protein n=1 Tax=Rhodofomes roseus TaxID=34475 RepID=A0A4Y9XTA4_9APHY|nr:hypothetical protein EVJ58_g9692 [Rhodofomes roseus]